MNQQTRNVIKLMDLFSDIDFQKKSWFGLGVDMSSPDELCNNIDDINFELWLKQNENLISFNLNRYIGIFLESINRLPNISDPFIAFSSNEWVSIRLQASVIVDIMRKELL